MEEQGASLRYFWTTILILSATASTWYFTRPTTESKRPTANSPIPSSNQRLQEAPARLWQNPLSAIADYEANSSKESPRSEFKKNSKGTQHDPVTQRLEDELSGKYVMIMPVFVPGSPYAEDVATRINTRFALIQSLGTQDFYPSDASHIGIFQPPDTADKRNAEIQLPQKVPFEIFSHKKSTSPDTEINNRRILVLWINEDDLGSHPLGSLTKLIKTLPRFSQKDSNPLVRVLGPATSTTLQLILKDYVEDKKKQFRMLANWPMENTQIINWRATALLEFVVDAIGEDIAQIRGDDTKGLQYARIPKPYASNRDFLVSYISDDYDVLQSVFNEFSHRICTPNDSIQPQHIAIVDELDTFYGRSIDITLRIIDLTALKGSPSFKHLRYLRGIDGKSANFDPNRKSDKDSGANVAHSSNANSEQAIAEGANQLDYLTRLATKIKDMDRDLRLKNNDVGIQAVGVLGSDLYDKLTVIKALRWALPDALFFTTDADARMLDPDVLSYTRNMLVGSAYGLEYLPASSEKGSIPILFRNVYQTSLATAVHEVIERWDEEVPPPDNSIHPNVYEIGLNGFSLVPKLKQEQSESQPDHFSKYPCEIWNAISKKIIWIKGKCVNQPLLPWLFLSATIYFLFALIQIGYYGIKKAFSTTYAAKSLQHGSWISCFKNQPSWKINSQLSVIAVLNVLAFAFLLILLWFKAVEEGYLEPLDWWNGISIWPTEAVRLLAVWLSFVFMLACEARMRWFIQIKMPRLGLEEPPAKSNAETGRPSRRKYHKVLDLLFTSRWLLTSQPNEQVKAHELWHEFRQRRTWRLPRALINAAVFGVIVYTMLTLTGLPSVPVRGIKARYWDQKFLFYSVGSYCLLLFFVIDHLLLSIRFISHLGSRWSDWSLSESGNKDGNTPGFRFSRKWVQGLEDLGFISRSDHPFLPAPDDPQSKAMGVMWDMRLIQRLTQTVDGMLYFPFIILALLILARNPFFDNWPWPANLVLLFVLCSLIIFGAAWHLRQAAAKVRSEELDKLRRLVSELQEPAKCSPTVKRIEMLIKSIEDLNEGAFAPLSHHPIVGSLLLGLGSAGSMPLLQWLITR